MNRQDPLEIHRQQAERAVIVINACIAIFSTGQAATALTGFNHLASQSDK
jgi:hypothetical protein